MQQLCPVQASRPSLPPSAVVSLSYKRHQQRSSKAVQHSAGISLGFYQGKLRHSRRPREHQWHEQLGISDSSSSNSSSRCRFKHDEDQEQLQTERLTGELQQHAEQQLHQQQQWQWQQQGERQVRPPGEGSAETHCPGGSGHLLHH